MKDGDVLSALLAGSPFVQILFEVARGGKLVGVAATGAAHRSGLLLVDDVQRRTIDEILRPEVARSIREGFRDALRVGEAVSHEEFVSVGDREVWGITTLTPLFDDDGVPAIIIMSFLDLDFVERTEAALSQVKTALREVVETSSDAIVLLQDGRIAYANAAAAKRLRASAANLVGRPLDARADARVIPLTSSSEIVMLARLARAK